MSIKTWRQKGRKGEYEVRDLLQPVINNVYETLGIPMEWAPKMERNANQMSVGVGGSDLKGVDWLGLEVKRQESSHMIGSWWVQCKTACMNRKKTPTDPDTYFKEPVLVWRPNNAKWRVRMMGFLLVDKESRDSPRVRTSVDIGFDAFLEWFKQRIIYEVRRIRDEAGLIGEVRVAKDVGIAPSSRSPVSLPIPPGTYDPGRNLDTSAQHPWDLPRRTPESSSDELEGSEQIVETSEQSVDAEPTIAKSGDSASYDSETIDDEG